MNMPPFWAMYVAVPKLEEAVAHIKRLGGSELSPVIEVPTVGRLQMMKDPQGAAFYIIQPASTEETTGEGARSGRGLVARADDHRRACRDEVLQRDLRVAAQRNDGHGSDGQVPHVQPASRHDRRHDEQAARDGARAAALDDLFPRARHQRRRRAHQGERRQDPQRADGGSRRRLDRECDGSAGRRVLTARKDVSRRHESWRQHSTLVYRRRQSRQPSP